MRNALNQIDVLYPQDMVLSTIPSEEAVALVTKLASTVQGDYGKMGTKAASAKTKLGVAQRLLEVFSEEYKRLVKTLMTGLADSDGNELSVAFGRQDLTENFMQTMPYHPPSVDIMMRRMLALSEEIFKRLLEIRESTLTLYYWKFKRTELDQRQGAMRAATDNARF